MNSVEMEIALAGFFGYRQNQIVPNVSYGLWIHECDLLIVSKSGYCTEVEIKISISDLKADFKKEHQHKNNKIKYFYYAIPEELKEKALPLIPEHAGLIIVKAHTLNVYEPTYCQIIKSPIVNKEARALTTEELLKLGHLSSMRIWSLKENLYNFKRNHKC
jgi:DNA polymerase III psi subunit